MSTEPKAPPLKSLYDTIAIRLLNRVKAWRDQGEGYPFPQSLREQIDAVLMAAELRAAEVARHTPIKICGVPYKCNCGSTMFMSSPGASHLFKCVHCEVVLIGDPL